jgi:methanogenic corrinoid protein MtbC1
MENTNLPKTTRVIDLLEELGEKEGQRAVLLTGPYTPDYVAKVAQDLLFEIAEIGAEIVQTVRDLESTRVEV